MILLDSSVIIAGFRSSETHHKKAYGVLQSGENFVVLDYVLAETTTVLKNREGHTSSVACLDFLTNHYDIQIESLSGEEFEIVLHYFKDMDNDLSFVDIALLVIKQSRGLTLATLDKELSKVALDFTL